MLRLVKTITSKRGLFFPNLLKNNIQPNKFEGLIGFIKWTVYQLATKRVLLRVMQNVRFLFQEEGEARGAIRKRKGYF